MRREKRTQKGLAEVILLRSEKEAPDALHTAQPAFLRLPYNEAEQKEFLQGSAYFH